MTNDERIWKKTKTNNKNRKSPINFSGPKTDNSLLKAPKKSLPYSSSRASDFLFSDPQIVEKTPTIREQVMKKGKTLKITPFSLKKNKTNSDFKRKFEDEDYNTFFVKIESDERRIRLNHYLENKNYIERINKKKIKSPELGCDIEKETEKLASENFSIKTWLDLFYYRLRLLLESLPKWALIIIWKISYKAIWTLQPPEDKEALIKDIILLAKTKTTWTTLAYTIMKVLLWLFWNQWSYYFHEGYKERVGLVKNNPFLNSKKYRWLRFLRGCFDTLHYLMYWPGIARFIDIYLIRRNWFNGSYYNHWLYLMMIRIRRFFRR